MYGNPFLCLACDSHGGLPPLIALPEQRLEFLGEPVNVALPPLTALPPL